MASDELKIRRIEHQITNDKMINVFVNYEFVIECIAYFYALHLRRNHEMPNVRLLRCNVVDW